MTDETPCPCGSGAALTDCCLPLIEGSARADTAEALMRSRYTAYTLHNIDYLGATLDPHEQRSFDQDATTRWARDSTWLGLEILATSAGGVDDDEGSVEFRARFRHDDKVLQHHEISSFRRINGHWRYSGGKDVGPAQVRRDTPKTGRNDPCPCGSGKKFKKCCGR